MTGPDGKSGRRLSSEELRAEIRVTRARFAEDVEAARLKLSRDGLRHEAVSALRGVRQESSAAVSDWGSSAERGASQIPGAVVGFIRSYPVATTLIGLGLAWLATRGARSGEPGPVSPQRRLPEARQQFQAEPHGWQ